MLGIRAAWREDADTTPVQLLYGTALRLPGEMIPSVPQLHEPDSDFLRVLQRSMRAGVPVPVNHHKVRPSYLPGALVTATSVYVRHDARRLPLQRPYDGPFAVLERGEKVFIINENGSRQTVSVDRLKPACLPYRYRTRPISGHLHSPWKISGLFRGPVRSPRAQMWNQRHRFALRLSQDPAESPAPPSDFELRSPHLLLFSFSSSGQGLHYWGE